MLLMMLHIDDNIGNDDIYFTVTRLDFIVIKLLL